MRRLRRFPMAQAALLPSALLVVFAYLGTMIWTVGISVTNSRILPSYHYVGMANYTRLFSSDRWMVSLENLLIFGVLFIVGCLIIGAVIAIYLDQRIRGESFFRTIFLYPYAMSFIVTGLVWQWMLNPSLGIEKAVQQMGLAHFRFDWITDQNMAIYTIVIAGIWQSAGLVVVLVLAGLRGIDKDLWNALRVDGIPTWRCYVSVILPNLSYVIGTAVVLLSIATIKVYDLVVAMTDGGPGNATEVPAKFIMDSLFKRANISLATAAATVLLLIVIVVLAPAVLVRLRAARQGRTA